MVFALHKSAFRDALCLKYEWQPTQLPHTCPCGLPFSVDHSFSFKVHGFPIIRHKEIHDLTADLISEVHYDVCVDPPLQPLSGESLSFVTSSRDDSA